MFGKIRGLNFFILFLFFIPIFLSGQSIKIDSVYKTNNYIYVSSHLEGKLPSDIFSYLKNGLKITIVYDIEVKDRKPFYYLFDKVIVSKTIKKIATYNLWEKCYYLRFNNKVLKINNKQSFVKELKEVRNIKLLPLKELDNYEKPFVSIKCRLESVKLFPPLSWIFDLVSSRGFETEWTVKDLK